MGNNSDTTFSRRSFISTIAMGTAGAVLALNGRRTARGAETEEATVTLDAILLIYVSPPLGSGGATTLTYGKDLAATLYLDLPQNPGIKLRAGIPHDDEGLDKSIVSQFPSTRVPGGITLRLDYDRDDRGTQIGGSQATQPPGIADNAVFVGISQPQLQFTGTGDSLKYRLIDATNNFGFSLADLQNPSSGIGQQTAASMADLFVTDPSNLILPRYELVTTIPSGGSVTIAARKRDITGVHATASMTANIVSQTGFKSASLVEAFAPGNQIQLTYSSVQEFPSKDLGTFVIDASGGSSTSDVYLDRVFKTYVSVPSGQ
jgi:hypothetical protein